MIDFETWWNSSSADEFRRLNDDMDGRVVRPVWDAAIRATLSSQKATSAAPSPEATQPTQAEAPSEGEALQLAWDKCKAACDPSDWTVSESAAYRGFFAHGYRAALATQQAEQPCGHPESLLLKSAETGEPLYCEACDDKSGRRDAEARETELLAANRALRAELAALKQQAVQGEPVAFEFYNPATGHAIVDYSRQTHVGPLTKEMGYEARPLGYVTPPPAAVKPSDPVPLWQALEALDSLEESSRGDAPYNHFAADLVRSALEQAATPPAPGQVERDREDAIDLLKRASESIGSFVSDHGWAQSDMDTMDAIDGYLARAARSSEGGGQ